MITRMDCTTVERAPFTHNTQEHICQYSAHPLPGSATRGGVTNAITTFTPGPTYDVTGGRTTGKTVYAIRGPPTHIF